MSKTQLPSDKRNTLVMQQPSAAGAKRHETITMLVRQEQRRRKRDRWIPVGAIVGVLVSLVILGLFLPPISAYSRYIDPTGDFITLDNHPTLDGLSLFPTGDAGNAQFLLLVAGSPDFIAAQNLPENWQCPLAETLPTYLEPVGTTYSLEQKGSFAKEVQLRYDLPEADVVDVYGYDAALARWRFLPYQIQGEQVTSTVTRVPTCLVFVEPMALPPVVGVSVALPTQFEDATLLTSADRYYIQGLTPARDGQLLGSLPSNISSENQRGVVPIIANYTSPEIVDRLTVEALISNPTAREVHVTHLINFAASENYSGLAIDYRQLRATPEMTDRFNRFLIDLARGLHEQGQVLVVIVPAPIQVDGTWDTGAYAWSVLGQIADEVIVRAPQDPNTYAENGRFERMVTWATTQINRYQLYFGFDTRHVEYLSMDEVVPLGAGEVVPLLANVTLTDFATAYMPGDTLTIELSSTSPQISQDETTGQSILFVNDRQIWLTDETILAGQMQSARQFGIGGVVLLDYEGSAYLYDSAISAFYGGESEANTNLVIDLGWAVRDADGNILTTSTDSSLSYTISDETGLEIVAQANFNGQTYELASQSLVVTSPTPPPVEPTTVADLPTETPTLEPTTEIIESTEILVTEIPPTDVPPTEEPTVAEIVSSATPIVETESGNALQEATPTVVFFPTNTPANETPFFIPSNTPADDVPLPTPTPFVAATNTLAPSATLPAQPTATFAPINLPPAIGSVALELGGQIEQLNDNTFNTMRSTQMNWIMIRIPYANRATPSHLRTQIESLHEQGFKVLYVVVGSPGDFDKPNYFSNYAGYVGALAFFEADAIQVWDAPNSPDFWVENQIDPAQYVALLSEAENAIRAADKGTLIISGALAPVPNAELYYQGMAAAGAANLVDCIGVRYDQGAVAPAVTTGDLRGEEYFYYLNSSIDLAYNTFGASRPVCLTVGYLSGEGYELTENFAWASNTTNALQAQWLGEATSLVRQAGKVQILTIWNVDFTFFGIDAAAGYAMLRRDGSCPACTTIAQGMAQ